MDKIIEKYVNILKRAEEEGCLYSVMRHMARTDLFFLLYFMCSRKDVAHPWLYERCMEVQDSPDGYIDLWAREHYKSTVITFGKTIQDIINNPNITIGIFSFKFNAASDFLKQIRNEVKKDIWITYFDDIFYDKPEQQAQSWSERAITVKRTSNKREATVEANGFVDALPTGKHYDLLLYDDIATEKSVTTEDQIRKTQEAFELSLSLGSDGGKRRIVGTFYSYDDIYNTIIDRKLATPRIYPMVNSENKPVFFSKEYAQQKKAENTSYIYACQYILDPKAESHRSFDRDWLRYWQPMQIDRLSRYMFIDPANSKNKRGDYTAIIIVGIGPDNNYYVIYFYRDKLSLSERGRAVMDLHRKYRPAMTYYESYGLQADIDYIKELQEREIYRFSIQKIAGKVKKEDRISQLEPLFRNERLYIPYTCMAQTIDGQQIDMTQEFVNEYIKFPFGAHDDFMDCLSRIRDDDVRMTKPSYMGPRKTKTKAKINYNWRDLDG